MKVRRWVFVLLFWGGRQAGFNGFLHNPVGYAADVQCPILFLHGGADVRAHLEEARRVFAAIRGFKQFREFQGIGHQACVIRYPDEWKSTVKEFLREVGNPLRPDNHEIPPQSIH